MFLTLILMTISTSVAASFLHSNETLNFNLLPLVDKQIWKVTFSSCFSKDFLNLIERFEEQGEIDIFEKSLTELIFMVDIQQADKMKTAFNSLNITTISVEVPSIAKYYTENDDKTELGRGKSFEDDKLHRKYLTYSEIESHLKTLAKSYKKRFKRKTIGRSFEGRSISMVIISPEKMSNSTPKTIFIEGGAHSREWISPAVVLFLIEMILKHPSLTNNVQIKIVPVMNPDGYVYSHTTNRLWRKNRRVNRYSNCIGVDLNRNWGFQFGGQGSSGNPCSNTFRGPYSFSEFESYAMRTELMRSSNIIAYLSIHSYSQLVLYPWGFSRNLYNPNEKDLESVAKGFSSAVRSINGVDYSPRRSAALYPSSGIAHDWVYGALGVKYTFTLELRDKGYFGFALPPRYIKPIGKEIWAGLRYLIKKIEKEN